MFWRLHTAIFGDQLQEAYNFLMSLGDHVQVVTGPSLTVETVPAIQPQAALAITTLQDARSQSGCFRGHCSPWLFYDETNYSVSNWLPRMETSIPVLNREGIWVPYGMLGNLSKELLRSLQSYDRKIFIKPDKGHKSFTGFSVFTERFHEEIQEHTGYLNLDPHVMCFLARHQQLKEIEWRFWIVNKQVVAWAPYSWEGDIPWTLAPERMFSLAREVAMNSWEPDLAYVVDIVETETGSVLVNEINAASTSGVYSAPIEDLLSALRDVAQLEFSGELTL